MNISLAAEALGHIGTFPITNTLVMGLLIVFFLMVIAVITRKKLATIPRGLQNIVEIVFAGALDFMESVVQDREQAKRFFPIVMTIFLFVLFSNWLELVPGLGSVGIYGIHEGHEILIPFIRSSSADLNVTLALAMFAVIGVQIMGVSFLGMRDYWGKFFVAPWHKPYGIGTFVGLLELVSEFAKMISFSFRLFGNIFAGEVLLLVVSFLAPAIIPIPFLALEIFVGFVQALVFSMLTLVFLKIAVTGHEEQAAH